MYLCAVYESPKIHLEINYLIKRAPKNVHINLLLITDTDTKKFQDGYGQGYKNFKADTDTIFVIFTDTVSVDGYMYPSDLGYSV